jgi:hypothetical protein
MTRDTDLSPVSRRYMLQTLGTVGAAGLAGCGGNGGSGAGGGSSPTGTSDVSGEDEGDDPSGDGSDPETTEANNTAEQIPPEDFIAAWMQSTDEPIQTNSFSPAKVDKKYGQTRTENVQGHVAYEDLNYSPEDVPQAFVQEFLDPVLSAVKVDRLPADVESGDVASTLEENGYENVQDMDEFSVYRNLSSDAVYAIGDSEVVIGVNYRNPAREAEVSQHEEDVKDAVEQRVEGDISWTEEIRDAFGALEDTGESLAIQEKGISGGKLVEDLDERYQPEVGILSVDLEEETKYGAWIFEDQNTAEWVYRDLEEGGTRYGWQSIERDENVITATGQPKIKQNLEAISPSGISVPYI